MMQSTHRQYYYSYESAKRRQLIDALMFLLGDFGQYRDLILQAVLIVVANFQVFVELLQWFVSYSDVIIDACRVLNQFARATQYGLDWCEAFYAESCRLWQDAESLFVRRLQWGI